MKVSDLAQLLFQDPEFVMSYSKFHPEVQNDLDSIVFDLWNRIKDCELHKTEYGYFGVDKDSDILPWLNGFFIIPTMRNKETVTKFWKDVENELGNCFMSGVYTKNTKAINFLKKHGKIMKETEDKTIFYFNKSGGI